MSNNKYEITEKGNIKEIRTYEEVHEYNLIFLQQMKEQANKEIERQNKRIEEINAMIKMIK